MRLATTAITVLALATAFGSGIALAAETTQPPMHGMPGMMAQDSGMMGMMGCPMMSRGMMGSAGLPMLPPGNEKLQLQMQAEIMQKVGEIMAKYSNQIQPRQ